MKALFVMLMATAALAACGDNPSGADMQPPVAGNEVPASALASTAAFAGYVASLPASDSAEPVDVNAATPPTSDTEEPQEI